MLCLAIMSKPFRAWNINYKMQGKNRTEKKTTNNLIVQIFYWGHITFFNHDVGEKSFKK